MLLLVKSYMTILHYTIVFIFPESEHVLNETRNSMLVGIESVYHFGMWITQRKHFPCFIRSKALLISSNGRLCVINSSI